MTVVLTEEKGTGMRRKRIRKRIGIATIATALLVMPLATAAYAGGSDNREAATTIAALPFSETASSANASTASDDPYPRCGNNSRVRSVWYSYTPQEAINLDAQVTSREFYPILSVWHEEDGVLRQAGCSAYTARVFLNAEAGTTYWFMISSYYAGGGTYTFSLQEAPEQIELGVAAEDKAWVNEASGNVTVTGEVACSRPATSISLQVVVSQGTHERYGYDYVDCENNNRWLVTVRGDFKHGQAEVDSQVSYHDTDVGQTSTASHNITADLRECTQIGTLGNDTMSGTERSDKICSLAGNDVINGGGGNDKLRGHDGDDRLFGGAGDDLLTGGFGADRLNGDTGSDTLYGDAGPDVLNGGRGSDRCSGREGKNVFQSCERRFN